MSLILGVDAGGTKTIYALAEGSKVLARTRAGSIKPLRVEFAQAEQHFAEAMTALAAASGRKISEVTVVVIGTAGISLKQTPDWMRKLVSAHTTARLDLCGDEEIALDAAFFGGRGVLVMAGTGSNVMGRSSDGLCQNVGGWGPLLGDQGSGHWVGLEGLRAALRAHDHGRTSGLMASVLEHWQCRAVEDLLTCVYGPEKPDFSQLAPLVRAAAEAGDADCLAVLERGGRLLGEDAAEACRKVMALDGGVTPHVAYTGSAISQIPAIRKALAAALHAEFPEAKLAEDPVDSVEGALWRARRVLGLGLEG